MFGLFERLNSNKRKQLRQIQSKFECDNTNFNEYETNKVNQHTTYSFPLLLMT